MRMKHIFSRVFVGALCLFMSHIISPQTVVLAATDHYHTAESFRILPGGSVVVEAAFHDVEVTLTSDSNIEVEINMQVTASSEQNVERLMNEYKPVFTEEENLLRIRSLSGDQFNFSWRQSLSGKIKISVPTNTDLQIKTASGDCVFRGDFSESFITSSTASGDISFQGEAERFTAHTASGRIEAEFEAPTALVEARSASGDIRISGPAKKTELHSASGNIDINGLIGEINVSNVSGDLNAYWESISDKINIMAETVSGDLRFRFPEDITVSGEMKSTSGRINSDFPGRFSGRSNSLFILDGGVDALWLSASTVSGSIDLTSRDYPSLPQIETIKDTKSSWHDVSFDLFTEDPSPVVILNLYHYERMMAPGLKYRLRDDLYATGNIEYSYRERDVEIQIGAVYFLPYDLFLFSFYGGGGAQFSTSKGYQYPYIMMGTDFLFFFAELIYPWETNISPRSRFGFSINF